MIVPVFQRQAKSFIGKHHRHNVPSIASIFNVGLEDDGRLIGVAMVGLPKARRLMDGKTLEVTRVCVLEGHRNANSMLYGACARIAKALGWKRLVTYTLETESGASLRAVGWTRDEVSVNSNVDNWAKRTRGIAGPGRGTFDLFGNQRIPDGPKIRWWNKL
jgi:hypothetical protein